jgi:hypothetical protein
MVLRTGTIKKGGCFAGVATTISCCNHYDGVGGAAHLLSLSHLFCWSKEGGLAVRVMLSPRWLGSFSFTVDGL